MVAQDTFSNATTFVNIDCPNEVTGTERIMLTARGDLQRLLSSFLGLPIYVETVQSQCLPYDSPASPLSPITQTRVVHLKCASRVVCVATSTVIITSTEASRLLLDEGYAIGQVFRSLSGDSQGKVGFDLKKVKCRVVDGKRELSRLYEIAIDGFKCEIEEVFPDRRLFELGKAWFALKEKEDDQEALITALGSTDRFQYDIPPTVFSKQADPTLLQPAYAAYSSTFELAKVVNAYASSLSINLKPLLRTSAIVPCVAVMHEGGYQLSIVVMALLQLNASVVFLAPNSSEATITQLLKQPNVQAILHSPEQANNAAIVGSATAVPTIAVTPTP